MYPSAKVADLNVQKERVTAFPHVPVAVPGCHRWGRPHAEAKSTTKHNPTIPRCHEPMEPQERLIVNIWSQKLEEAFL